jgi:membrane fusion protein, heavy metal efflux system
MNRRNLSLCFFLANVLLSSCNRSQTAAEPRPPTADEAKQDEVVLSTEQRAAAMIDVQPAAAYQEPDLLRVKGKIALADDRTWRVGVRTPGVVDIVSAGLGDYVHRGQVLARYRADEVRDSRARYRAALSELDRTKAAAAQAQRNRDRAQKLLELKAGSVQQVELAQQDLISAQAEVRQAEIEVERGRDLLENGLRVPANPPPGRKDETDDEVPIISPGDGYIIEKNVTPGKTVELSSVTFVIGDLTKLWMLASVRQEDLPKLRQEQPASVTLVGVEGTSYHGRIINLGQEFDPATRMMQVRIELNNTNSRLRPEMLADALIPVGGGTRRIFVPSDALQQVNGQDVVFVQTAPDRFAARPVQVGETADGRTPILQGIQAGDAVAVRGSFVLKSELLKSTLESE